MSGDAHVRFCESPRGRVPRATRLLVFTPSKKDAEAALGCVTKGLKKLDLILNTQKTRVVPAGPKVIFLGRKLPGKKQDGR